jgi:hypothetical protein
MTCTAVHETSVTTKLSQIEQDLRTLIKQGLHDVVVNYVDSLFYSIKHGAVVRNMELV